jgi:hypothetical protein
METIRTVESSNKRLQPTEATIRAQFEPRAVNSTNNNQQEQQDGNISKDEHDEQGQTPNTHHISEN